MFSLHKKCFLYSITPYWTTGNHSNSKWVTLWKPTLKWLYYIYHLSLKQHAKLSFSDTTGLWYSTVWSVKTVNIYAGSKHPKHHKPHVKFTQLHKIQINESKKSFKVILKLRYKKSGKESVQHTQYNVAEFHLVNVYFHMEPGLST